MKRLKEFFNPNLGNMGWGCSMLILPFLLIWVIVIALLFVGSLF